jgi:hypothetical protein
MYLAKASEIVHREIFAEQNKFSGSWVDISNTRSYEMQMPCWNRASVSCRFLVFTYKRRPT